MGFTTRMHYMMYLACCMCAGRPTPFFCSSVSVDNSLPHPCIKESMYQVSLKSEGGRPFFVITWPGITH